MKMKEKNFISAVVYVRNGEKTIRDFLENIHALFSENFEKYEILCVNDASEDNSVAKIKEAAREITSAQASVSIVNMSCYHGIEAAMTAGTDTAIGDFVYEFDRALIDFDLDVLMQAYRKALSGYDIVGVAAREKQKFSSKFFYAVFNQYTNYQYELRTESFRILSRRALNRAGSLHKTMPYRKAVYANCGLHYAMLEYEKIMGTQHMPMEKRERARRRNLAVDSLILFTDVAYRFSIGITICMMCIAVLMAFYTVVVFLMGNPVEGWTTTVSFLSLAFFGLFGILTVIVKYLSILVSLIFRRQKYVFESIEKITKSNTPQS